MNQTMMRSKLCVMLMAVAIALLLALTSQFAWAEEQPAEDAVGDVPAAAVEAPAQSTSDAGAGKAAETTQTESGNVQPSAANPAEPEPTNTVEPPAPESPSDPAPTDVVGVEGGDGEPAVEPVDDTAGAGEVPSTPAPQSSDEGTPTLDNQAANDEQTPADDASASAPSPAPSMEASAATASAPAPAKTDVKKAAVSKATKPARTLADGKYLLLWAKNANYLVQSLKNSRSSGANILLAKNTATIRQRWAVKYLPDSGYYTIVNEYTKKALAIAAAKNGANVLQVTAKSGDASQLWVVTKVGKYYVFAPKSNTKLSLTGVSMKSGYNLILRAAAKSMEQRFDAKQRGLVRDSAYSIALYGKPKQTLEVKGYSDAEKAKMQWTAYKGELNQKYRITYVGDEKYTVQSLQTGKYLSVVNGVVVQRTNGKAAAQRWIISLNGGGIALKNAQTGLRLAAPGGKVDNGVLPSTAKAANNGTQRFILHKRCILDNGIYLIRTCADRRALGVQGGSVAQYGNVDAEKLSSSNRQKFRLYYLGNGVYRIINVKSALDIGSANGKAGANVRQRSFSSNDTQRWKVKISKLGGIKFVNVNTGKVLDIAGTDHQVGANVRMASSDNSAEQRWWVQKTATKADEAIVDKALRKAQSQGSSTNYYIAVDTTNHRTIVLKRSGNTWKLAKNFACSTGAPESPTVLGSYTVGIKGYSFGDGYTCYYYTQFWGDYLFHSVLYYQGTRQIMDGRLGLSISAGCVRLAIENAKWIYDTIPSSTRVNTYR